MKSVELHIASGMTMVNEVGGGDGVRNEGIWGCSHEETFWGHALYLA